MHAFGPALSKDTHGAFRLRNMRIRDEFQCPITYELLRDPVIAADGNTYERVAIEKWLSKTQTSPLSGETLEHVMVSPNRALKKIIQDLIEEGGVGLYTVDAVAKGAAQCGSSSGSNSSSGLAPSLVSEGSAVDPDVVNENGDGNAQSALGAIKQAPKVRCVDVYKEKVLVFKGVGPPEVTEWYQQSFQLTPRGCMGGRNNHGRNLINKEATPAAAAPSSSSACADSSGANPNRILLSEDMVVFKEENISRQHFEMSLLSPGTYGLRDLGSVGGTFLRVHSKAPSFSLPLAAAAVPPAMLGGAAAASAAEGAIPALGADNTTVVLDSLKSGTSAGGEGRQRVPGQRLWPFALFSLGKHSFIVEKIDDRCNVEGNAAYVAGGALVAGSQPSGKNQGKVKEAAQSIIKEAEDVLLEIKRVSAECKNLSAVDGESRSESKNDGARDQLLALQKKLNGLTAELSSMDAAAIDAKSSNSRSEAKSESRTESCGDESRASGAHPFDQRRCVITCIGPAGSPAAGKSFVIGAGGAIIGRQGYVSSNIQFQGEHKSEDGGKESYGEGLQISPALLAPMVIPVVDTAVTAQHARIIMDPRSGTFTLCDGAFEVAVSDSLNMTYTLRKNSTNGTWLRLSPEGKKSPWFEIHAGMEVQVSLIRFTVGQGDDTIYEKEVIEG